MELKNGEVGEFLLESWAALLWFDHSIDFDNDETMH